MATQTVKIFVQENGEKRELIGDELAAFLAQKEIDAAEIAAQKTVIDAIYTQKAALLDRLGITADEAKLLLA